MTLIVIPFCTDETATAWSTSIGDYVEGQLCSTKEQLMTLAGECGVIVGNNQNHIINDILNDAGLSFDMIAVLDDKHLDVVAKSSQQALDHGCDSSLYSACEDHNALLVELADFILPI